VPQSHPFSSYLWCVSMLIQLNIKTGQQLSSSIPIYIALTKRTILYAIQATPLLKLYETMSYAPSTRMYHWSPEGKRLARPWSPTEMINAFPDGSGHPSASNSPLSESRHRSHGSTAIYTGRGGLSRGQLQPLDNGSTYTNDVPSGSDEPPQYDQIFGSDSSALSGSGCSFTSAHSTWAAASNSTSGAQSGSPTKSQAPRTSHGESSGGPLTSNTTAESKKPWYKPSTWAPSNSQRQTSLSNPPTTGTSDYLQPGSEFERPHGGRRRKFKKNVNGAREIMSGMMIGWNKANPCHH
jgi:hypothetical protein